MVAVSVLLAVVVPLALPGPVVGVAGALPGSAGGAAGARPGWVWPLVGTPSVVRPFDPPDTPYGPGHRGVDLAGAPGATVLAAGAGVVAFAGRVAGRGVVSVQHAGGLRTTYEPVTASVAAGAPVELGSPLGSLDTGHPGCPVPACLHWGLRREQTYLNPLLLLRPHRVRLKPLAPVDAPGLVSRSAGVVRRRSTHSRSASIACTRSEGVAVATLMIRDLDEGVKARLRVRAARNGRSMEAEARAILADALIEPATPRGLGSWIRQQCLDLDDLVLETPPRIDAPRAADLAS